MAQWDVYINPSPGARADLPFVVDVQSGLLGGLATRLVVPFGASRISTRGLPPRMNPRFRIAGTDVVLLPQEAGAVLGGSLKRPVATLRQESPRIINAINAVFSGV